MVINDVNQITPQTISNMTKTKNRKILTESEMVSLKNNLIQTKPVDLNDKTTYPGYDPNAKYERPAFTTGPDEYTIETARQHAKIYKAITNPKFLEQFYQDTGFRLAVPEIGSNFYWNSIETQNTEDLWQVHVIITAYKQTDNSYSNLGDAINDLASKYSVLKDNLEKIFSDEKLATQFLNLNNTFSNIISKLGDKAEKVLGETFGDGSKFRNSTIDVFWQRTQSYSQYINENSNYSGLKGTENEDLINDVDLMATFLRKNCDGQSYGKSSSTANISRNNLYSENELRAASDFMRMKDFASETTGHSAEEYGFAMGIASAKVDMIIDNYKIYGEFAQKMQMILEDKFEKEMSVYEKYINSFMHTNKKFQINRKDMQEMFEYVRSIWKQKGDITETMLKSAAELSNRFYQKAESTLNYMDFSYSEPSSFIKNLFKPFDSLNSYNSNSSLQKLAKNWNWFIEGINGNNFAFANNILNVRA